MATSGTVDELKRALVAQAERRNNRFGYLGERLFEEAMRRHGHVVTVLHKGGADLLIDGTQRVDVKTSVRLGPNARRSIRQVPRKIRIPETSYAYVLLLEEEAVVALAVPDGNPVSVASFSWEEVLRIHGPVDEVWNQTSAQGSEAKRVRMATEHVLAEWIQKNWGCRAKIVVRSNRPAQEKMGASGWGPEAFHEKRAPGREPVDLVVLLYFDDTVVYEVFAYPTKRAGEIAWTTKVVGPNRQGRMTFDPMELSAAFKFTDIDDFKLRFPVRFAECMPPRPGPMGAT